MEEVGLRKPVRKCLRLIHLWINWGLEKNYGDENVVKKNTTGIDSHIHILSPKDSLMTLKLGQNFKKKNKSLIKKVGKSYY